MTTLFSYFYRLSPVKTKKIRFLKFTLKNMLSTHSSNVANLNKVLMFNYILHIDLLFKSNYFCFVCPRYGFKILFSIIIFLSLGQASCFNCSDSWSRKGFVQGPQDETRHTQIWSDLSRTGTPKFFLPISVALCLILDRYLLECFLFIQF